MKAPSRNTLTYVLQGSVLTLLLVGVKILAEHTSVRHRAELYTFDVLRAVAPVVRSEELPVMVVDTSEIKEKDGQIIDLAKLKEITAAVAEQRPRAIAIALILNPKDKVIEDRNNSALPTEAQAREYYDFLEFCLKLKSENKVPIFLGVGEVGSGGQPRDWLGQEKYKELAATSIHSEDTSRILVWLKAGADAERLFSLSASLSRAYTKPRLPNGISWAVETTGEGLPAAQQDLEEGVEYAEAPINYGKLEGIMQGRLLTSSGASVEDAGARLRHKVVLLGDGTFEAARASEVFTPPGRNEQFPGVYMHACAAYTFAREPLYEIKLGVRLALDVCLSLLAFGCLALVRPCLHGAEGLAASQRSVVLVCAAGAASLLAGVTLVYWLGLLWLDFMLVGLALCLRPAFAKALRRSPEGRHVLAHDESADASGAQASHDKSPVSNGALPAEQGSVTPGPQTAEAADSRKRKILFIAANPTDASGLQTDREHRIIKAEMERGSHRDKFEFLQPLLAVTITELLRAMNGGPNIVHFSGHGSSEGIFITREDNQSQVLTTAALERLFKPLKDCTEIVVLNSCYSAAQAEFISRLGMYVVGNNLPVDDGAAISFAKGLYVGLSEGKPLEAAVNDARIVVMTEARDYSTVVEVWSGGRKLDV